MKVKFFIILSMCSVLLCAHTCLALDGKVAFGCFFDQDNVRSRPDGGLSHYRSEIDVGHQIGFLTGRLRPFLNLITLMDGYNGGGTFHPDSIRYTAGISWEKNVSERFVFFTTFKHFCWHPVDNFGTVESANYFETGFRF